MVCGMRDWLVLIAHLIITTIRTIAPGGARAVIAESLLLKHQLLILNRSRKKAPRLRALDRILLGLGAILVSPRRILKVAVAIRPATLLRFYRALVRRKYQWLFSAKTGRRPGPKGPSKELIAAVLEIKRLNPRFGCPRIAQQISHAFGLEIDKDVVRRILANHHFPKPGGEGPSWLSIIAEARDSLWSADLFHCESVLENVYGVWSTRVATKSGARSPTPKPESYRRNVPTHSGRPQTRRRTDDGTTPTSLRIIVAMCCWLEKPQATATSAIGIGLSRSRPIAASTRRLRTNRLGNTPV